MAHRDGHDLLGRAVERFGQRREVRASNHRVEARGGDRERNVPRRRSPIRSDPSPHHGASRLVKRSGCRSLYSRSRFPGDEVHDLRCQIEIGDCSESSGKVLSLQFREVPFSIRSHDRKAIPGQ